MLKILEEKIKIFEELIKDFQEISLFYESSAFLRMLNDFKRDTIRIMESNNLENIKNLLLEVEEDTEALRQAIKDKEFDNKNLVKKVILCKKLDEIKKVIKDFPLLASENPKAFDSIVKLKNKTIKILVELKESDSFDSEIKAINKEFDKIMQIINK